MYVISNDAIMYQWYVFIINKYVSMLHVALIITSDNGHVCMYAVLYCGILYVHVCDVLCCLMGRMGQGLYYYVTVP